MTIGTVIVILGLSYALGVLWYELFNGKLPGPVWRVAAYPFLGIIVAEMLMPSLIAGDARFGGIRLLAAFLGSLAGVVIDLLITRLHHRQVMALPEPLAEHRAA